MMNKYKLWSGVAVVLAVIGLVASVWPARAQGQPGCDYNGDGKCDGADVVAYGQALIFLGQSMQQTAQAPTATSQATVAPATLTPAPTVAPTIAPATTTPVVATVAPQPTATATMPPMAMGKCGESLTVWHPPVITAAYKTAHPEQPMLVVNCATEHEHGAETPAWVVTFEQSRGRVFSYMGMHNTSPVENVAGAKHVAMKGYSGVLVVPQGNVEFYAVLHGTEVPFERAATVHSARFWFRFKGAVSHIQFHGDFGNATDNERRFLRGRVPAETDVRGVMLVVDRVSVAAGTSFGQWYNEPGKVPFAVDYGISFGNIGTYYKRGEEMGNVYDMSRWDMAGGTNNVRRLELAWYPNRFAFRGIFWTTVLGDMVSGPTDPRCSEFACVEQVIQTNLPELSFASTGGKNAFQQAYPDTGVKMPN